MNKIAIITSLFDYPSEYLPTFYSKAVLEFPKEDIHIIRNSGLIQSESYYDKLYFYKVVKVLEYIEKNIVGKYDYILFLDATDTAFIKPLEGIIEKFNKLKCSVILGGEKGLWPHTNYTHLYSKKRIDSEYQYLNSGTYFGYTDKIVHYLSDIIEKEYQLGIDDQGKWTIEYLLNDDILIDQECNFFFSTYNSKEKIIINNNEVTLNGVDAYIVHDNGPHNDETIKLVNNFK
jgi:hypothetical protein